MWVFQSQLYPVPAKKILGVVNLGKPLKPQSGYTEVVTQCLLKEAYLISHRNYRNCRVRANNIEEHCMDKAVTLKDFCLNKAKTEKEEVQCNQEYREASLLCKEKERKTKLFVKNLS